MQMEAGLRNITYAWGECITAVLWRRPLQVWITRATALPFHTLLGYFYSVILPCGMTRHSPTCRCQTVLHKVIWGREHALKGKIQPALQDLGWVSEPLEQFKIYHSPGYSDTENEYVQKPSCSLFLQ